jgi:hypothetical protein
LAILARKEVMMFFTSAVTFLSLSWGRGGGSEGTDDDDDEDEGEEDEEERCLVSASLSICSSLFCAESARGWRMLNAGG